MVESAAVRHEQPLKAALIVILSLSVTACGGGAALGPATQGLAYSGDSGAGAQASRWTFKTLNSPDDHGYNVLEGINNLGEICGYYGDGSHKQPSRGFCVTDYGSGSFQNENYPSATDTEVTSLSNAKSIAGWYVVHNGIFGFIRKDGVWQSYKDLELRKGTSNITKLLGISDSDLAVGYYTDSDGKDHAFELNAQNGTFHNILPSGAVSSVAAGINGKGDIVGWLTTSTGVTKSWLLKGGSFTYFSYPGSANTRANAINWTDQICGSFVEGKNSTHGFMLYNPLGSQQWLKVDEPKARGTTVLTSVENNHYMVGYYVDAAHRTNGFLASPTY
jgi:uncharacterized membrane protein